MHSCKQVETPLVFIIGWILATFSCILFFYLGGRTVLSLSYTDNIKTSFGSQNSWKIDFMNPLSELWPFDWFKSLETFTMLPPYFLFPHKQMKPLVQSSRNHVSTKQIKSLQRMNIEGEEWRIDDDLLAVVILHLELLTACDIITLQIAIYKQLRKYDLCITIGLTKPPAYYKQLPPAYFPVGCRKEGMHRPRELDAI